MHERNRPARVSDDLLPIGFWSYTTSDDTSSRGKLSQLRRLLADELQQKVGRRSKVLIWQDAKAIPHGATWREEIHKGIDGSSFFIPIVTPAFLESEWCCYEVMRFHALEQQRGRNDLIFPLHYVDTDDFHPEEAHDPQVLTLLRARQMFDFRRLRVANYEGEDVARALDAFTDSIKGALRVGRRGTVASVVVPVTPAAEPERQGAATPPASPAIITRPDPPKPGTIRQDAPDLPEMVLLDKGTYLRGIPPEETKRENSEDWDRSARPIRSVTIPAPFWLARAPVTRGQFAAFVQATNRRMPTEALTYEPNDKGEWAFAERPGRDWRNPGFEQTDRHPVVCVSHEDALAYIEWLNQRTQGGYRLPSESEWEYAARAGTTTARFWGDGPAGACQYANVADHALMRRMGRDFDPTEFFDCDDGFPFTAPVRSFQPNPFDLHDMLGNVWEWCADQWHDSYEGCPTDGSARTFGGDKDRRVLRGGSWDIVPWFVRAGIRHSFGVDIRHDIVGFRPARTLFPPES